MKITKRAVKLLAIAITVILAFAMLSSCANVSGSSVADSQTVSPASSNLAEQSSPSPSEMNSYTPYETDQATPDAAVTHENSTAPTLSVLFINVGKADCALITFGNHHYLIDTGSADSLPILIRALNSMNVSSLDGIFITHPHKDHIGGLPGLLSQLDVQKVYMPKITDYEPNGSNKV
ncbi:MAG: MBL fold metallo-hydrolase, partial [Clostridia bacterium]|nr:MBL fold metallo-hydrolase [Clostridia bacterium]